VQKQWRLSGHYYDNVTGNHTGLPRCILAPAPWIKRFGQRADFMALVEDGLLRGIGFWNLILGVVRIPKQLPALTAPEEFCFGDVRPLRCGGSIKEGAGHAGLCDAGRAQFEQEEAVQPQLNCAAAFLARAPVTPNTGPRQ